MRACRQPLAFVDHFTDDLKMLKLIKLLFIHIIPIKGSILLIAYTLNLATYEGHVATQSGLRTYMQLVFRILKTYIKIPEMNVNIFVRGIFDQFEMSALM